MSIGRLEAGHIGRRHTSHWGMSNGRLEAGHAGRRINELYIGVSTMKLFTILERLQDTPSVQTHTWSTSSML